MIQIIKRVTSLVGDAARKITGVTRGILGGSKKTSRDKPEPSRKEEGDKAESEKEE